MKIMDKIIHLDTHLQCSQDEAFTYFFDNQLLCLWLTKKANVEMKVGGNYELFWNPENADPEMNSTFGCKVLALEEPYFFCIEWKGNVTQKQLMNQIRPLTAVTVIFIRLEDHLTRVSLLHTGWRPGSKWEEARLYFVNAWRGALANLEQLINQKN